MKTITTISELNSIIFNEKKAMATIPTNSENVRRDSVIRDIDPAVVLKYCFDNGITTPTPSEHTNKYCVLLDMNGFNVFLMSIEMKKIVTYA